MMAEGKGPSTSRPIPPSVLAKLNELKPGQRVRITQIVKVGSTKTWPLVVHGVFRHLDSLATGLATDRRREDDVIVPVIHFTKDNKEMSSITIDERTKVEVIGS